MQQHVKRGAAYLGIALAFTVGLGYERHIDLRTEHAVKRQCSYEWYNYDRRISIDQVVQDLAEEMHSTKAAGEVQDLLNTLIPPNCPRPAKPLKG